MKDKKITRIRRVPHIHIGFILLVFVSVYLGSHIVSFFSDKHIPLTEVKQGQIVTDDRFRALALREETLVEAGDSGTACFYLPEESRVKKNETVLSLDKTGQLLEEFKGTSSGSSQLSDEQKSQVTEMLAAFTGSYSPERFQTAYSLKQNLSDYLYLMNGEKTRKSLGKSLKELVSSGSVVNVKSPSPGLMCLSYDGLSGLTEEGFSEESFDESALVTTEVSTGDELQAGDVAFRLVTSDFWKLVTPLTEAEASKLRSANTIEVRFDKDSSTAWARSHIIEKDGSKYLVLEFDDSMDRFSDSRFLDIELVMDKGSGLKVPNSSIVTRTEESEDGGYVNTYGVYLANKGYTQFVKVKVLYKNGQYSIIEPFSSSSLQLYDYIVLDASGVEDGEIINYN